MSNEEKSAQLGMPIGTANGRLRKMILFMLIQKYGENLCYRCNQLINNIDEFSIEHKSPWFNISADLFWDLNNISFSHLSCNIAASDRPWGKDKNAPPNMLWCTAGKHYVSNTLFYTNPSKNRGYGSSCKLHAIKETDKSRRAKGLRPALLKYNKPSKY